MSRDPTDRPPSPEEPQRPPSPESGVPPGYSAGTTPPARASAVPQLREMRIGQLLDAAVNLYRRGWRTFMGITALVLVPFHFLEQLVTWDFSTLENQTVSAADATGVFVVLGIQFLVIQPFLTAAIARAASELYLGRTLTIGETYGFAARRIGTIIWVTFLTFLAVASGFLLLIIPAALFYVRFLFGPAVVVVEGRRGTAALRRSWRLAKGHFWKLFGTVLLAGILSNIVGSIISAPFTVAGAAIGDAGWLLAATGSSLAGILTTPFFTMIAVLLYFDMRIRKEGFDLELMAQDLAREPGEV